MTILTALLLFAATTATTAGGSCDSCGHAFDVCARSASLGLNDVVLTEAMVADGGREFVCLDANSTRQAWRAVDGVSFLGVQSSSAAYVFYGLMQVHGDIVSGPQSEFTSASFPHLTRVFGSVTHDGTQLLRALSFPTLKTVDGSVAFSGLTWLRTCDMPVLAAVTGTVGFTAVGIDIEFPGLASCGGLRLDGATSRTAAFPALRVIAGHAAITSCPNLLSVAAEELERIQGDLLLQDTLGLEDMALPSLGVVDGDVVLDIGWGMHMLYFPQLTSARTVRVTSTQWLHYVVLPRMVSTVAFEVTCSEPGNGVRGVDTPLLGIYGGGYTVQSDRLTCLTPALVVGGQKSVVRVNGAPWGDLPICDACPGDAWAVCYGSTGRTTTGAADRGKPRP